MSVQNIREQKQVDRIRELEWTDVRDSGTELEIDVSLEGEPIELSTSSFLSELLSPEYAEATRIEQEVKEQYDEGLVAVHRETEDVILTAIDSHQLAEELLDIDIDPDKILIVRVDE